MTMMKYNKYYKFSLMKTKGGKSTEDTKLLKFGSGWKSEEKYGGGNLKSKTKKILF